MYHNLIRSFWGPTYVAIAYQICKDHYYIGPDVLKKFEKPAKFYKIINVFNKFFLKNFEKISKEF